METGCLLLPVLGKNFENIGFKENRNTTLSVTLIISNIQTARRINEQPTTLFPDTNKALDNVGHKGIL